MEKNSDLSNEYESELSDKNSYDDNTDSEGDEEENSDSDNDGESQPKKRCVYLPGQPLNEGEELTYDSSAYIMYHQAYAGFPCLSFDIIQDDLGESRETFPLSCSLIGGSQTESRRDNSLVILKMTNLTKMKHKNDDDSSSSSSSEDEDSPGKDPVIKSASIKHPGCVNRIKCCKIQNASIAASWSSEGSVHVWNLSESLRSLDLKSAPSNPKKKLQKPIFSFPGHQCEGFALGWNTLVPGRLASGDNNKNIHIWTLKDTMGLWVVDQLPLAGHQASVEDVVWSPAEPNVLASCSSDRSIRIWDIRCSPAKANKICISDAHDSDVNVIDWNKIDGKFLLSGGDDGVIKVWDLAMYRKDSPLTSSSAVAKLKHHTQAVTSVEWHPTDSTVFASSGEDDQVAVWDIAVEKDDDEVGGGEELAVLPQILFVHQGQKEIKEVHWHAQLTGVLVSTALNGFDIFRTINS